MGIMDKNSGDWRLLDEAWTFLTLADEAQRMGDRRSAERFIDLAMKAFDAAEGTGCDEPNLTAFVKHLRESDHRC